MNQSQPVPTDPSADELAGRVTPMMEQYVEIKAANPDCLLFYRMGDFYELFFDDAVTASRALGIVLTKRGKHLGQDIAMCGVPVHAADDYLQKLIGQGFRVAVCEQTEDPAEARRRGPKSVVRRAVQRLVTPGTITEDKLLDPGRNNYLAAIVKIAASDGADRHAAAWLDISTGEFRMGECPPGGIAALLARIEPREVLVPDRLAQEGLVRVAIGDAAAALTPLPPAFFDAGGAEARLCALFGVATLSAFGAFSRAEIAAGAALVAYVEKTQVARRPPIEPPRRIAAGDIMRVDAATRQNLELFRTVSGARAGSLVAAVDRTRTAAGSRLLAERLANPLCDPRRIAERLDAVAFFVEHPEARRAVRQRLDAVPDMLRALSRLGLERGGPRDLDAIRAGLHGSAAIAAAVPLDRPQLVEANVGRLDLAGSLLAAALQAALADELPLLKRDGNFVRGGYDRALDEARALRDESRRVVAALQARYAEATGVRALKIRHNNVLGYFVEVAAGQAAPLAADSAGFVHRQTLASVMRFTTLELAELEQRIANAAEQALALELAAFDDLSRRVAAETDAIRAAAQSLAELDVAAALADLAMAEGYVRPKVDGSLAFEIVGGRHPVVEQALTSQGVGFVGNHCALGPEPGEEPSSSALPGQEEPSLASPQGRGRIMLLTGPNMAGKSTYLRQNALIAILAQAGSFVPAASAHIGVVDALFSRVGAADDLARGRSTFMVEMVETAAILNQAGPRALVILDEIGRGTATFDGLSIAWAAVEHLHDTNGCRALFATHFHELTALATKLPRLANATVKVKEWKGDVVFLHEVVSGAADRSYGIQVAKLAGLPPAVIARARQVLQSLEKGDRSRPSVIIDDLPLFALRADEPTVETPHPALAMLTGLDPDELSPKEALERLYALKRLAPIVSPERL